MSVIALIGARSGSKGVPHKNIRPLAGHELLTYSIVAAQKAGIERVFVSTDFIKDFINYADIAKVWGAEVIMRPPELARDDSTDYEFIAHALQSVACELIVHLRPTTPLRDPKLIVAALAALRDEDTSLRSVHEMSESAYKCVEIGANGYLSHLTKVWAYEQLALDVLNDSRASFAKTYHPNGYVDILRSDFILKNQKIHGERVRAFVTPQVVEVDTEEDFALLEYQVIKHPELVRGLFG